jgi:hypothetical protein
MKTFTLSEAQEVARNLNINFYDFTLKTFLDGMNVELEHGTIDRLTNITNDNPMMTGKIALAHLKECGCYYEKLHDMEKTFS